MIVCVTRCLIKQWLLLYYCGGGKTFKNVPLGSSYRQRMPMASPLNRREADHLPPIPKRGRLRRPGRPTSCDSLENAAATDHRSEAKASKGWSTEGGGPTAELSQETRQGYRCVTDGSGAPSAGGSRAATGLLTSGPELCSGLVVHPYAVPY